MNLHSTQRGWGSTLAEPSPAARRPVGLSWLIRLRWLTVAAQGLAVLTAAWMGPVELAGPFGLLAATVASNLGLRLFAGRMDERRILGPVLAADALLLTALLHLTGGPMNPFTALYFVHITLAAVLLDTRWVGLLLVLSLAGFGLLFALDSGRPVAHHGGGLALHLQGMWMAFAVSSTLLAFFVSRLTSALARREEELSAARERTARSRRIAAVASLAAGAAHELGTPIGSIAIAAEELDHALAEAEPALREDVRLIRREVKRCRRILDDLSVGAGEAPGEPLTPVSLQALRARTLERLAPAEVGRVEGSAAEGSMTAPPAALALALASLVRNGLEAGDGPVRLSARLDEHWAVWTVEDRGRGMPQEVLERAEEPFFSTKPEGAGMGLGLFLVRALAEQLGGSLTLSSELGRGTTATLRLPLRTGSLREGP